MKQDAAWQPRQQRLQRLLYNTFHLRAKLNVREGSQLNDKNIYDALVLKT